MEAREIHKVAESPPRLYFYLQTVPADVCKHGNRYGQRPPEKCQSVGSMDWADLP